MRILVAGGNGQVGSALIGLGADLGLDLVGIGRSELDITNETSIAKAFDKYHPGLLINAAAYTSVDKAETEVELAFLINEKATSMLADACAAVNIPMFHLSTDYVFDGLKVGPYTEVDLVNPLAVYAKSKEAGERVLRARLERHIILRTSWVFGVHGNNFVKTIVRLAQNRSRLTVVADQFGGPTSARGIAAALVEIVAKFEQMGNVNWGTYHYCEKPYVNWYQFAKSIVARASQLGLLNNSVEIVPINSSEFETQVERPINSCLDTSKYERNFNIPKVSWIDEIDRVLENLK